MNNLKELVIAESYALREHATQEERERLDFKILMPSYWDKCIYGQLTSDCFSDRARHLLTKCTRPYSGGISEYIPDTQSSFFESGRAFSPIEFYIFQPNAQNETLIQFLRGERDSLTIQDL